MILGQGFGGEEVQRARVGIGENFVENRQVVAQGFTAGGRRDDDDIFAGVDRFGCCGLMRIELMDALGVIRLAKVVVNPGRKVCPLGGARRVMADSGEDFAVGVTFGEGVEDVGHGSKRGGLARSVDGGDRS